MISSPPILYRPIDPQRDAAIAYENYRDASFASYGRDVSEKRRYLPWLHARVQEFPEGHLLAYLENKCIGQLELQVPYGLTSGYINLFYVSKKFRRQGFGRLLHARAEKYFRSWEANRIELDVASINEDAVCFYLAMGYRFSKERSPHHPLRRMFKQL